MQKQSKISDFEWWLVLAATATVDISQAALDCFAIGLVANRFIDIWMAMALPTYFLIRGVPFDTKAILLFAGSFLGEEIPVLDAAPFWTFDVWKMRGWNRKQPQPETEIARLDDYRRPERNSNSQNSEAA